MTNMAQLLSIGEGWWRIDPTDEQAGRTLVYRLGAERFVDRVVVAWARSQCGIADAPWRALATLPQRWAAPVFPIKAADFIARGVEKGPLLGKALRAAEEAWIAADFPGDDNALRRIIDAGLDAANAAKIRLGQ